MNNSDTVQWCIRKFRRSMLAAIDLRAKRRNMSREDLAKQVLEQVFKSEEDAILELWKEEKHEKPI